MKKSSNYLKMILRAAAVILMAAAAGAVILYQAGYYDISFIRRPDNKDEEKDSVSGTADSGYETSELPPIDNGSAETDPNGSAEVRPGTDPAETEDEKAVYKKELASLWTVNDLKKYGYTRTSEAYNRSNTRIGMLTETVVIPPVYMLKSNTPVLQSYMGYIKVELGYASYILNSEGKTVASGTEALEPAYRRDDAGHPLYFYNGDLYYISDETGNMIRVGTDPVFAPALAFASAEGYGEPKLGLRRYYVDTTRPRKISASGADITDRIAKKIAEAAAEGVEPVLEAYTIQYQKIRLWGYTDTAGNVVIPAQYYFAAEFNENGLAVVADDKGVVKLISRSGAERINPYGRVVYLEERGRRPSIDGYYLPESYGIESIGMFYFDHGMMRVRRMIYDYYYDTQLVSDTDVLIREDGTLFSFPQEYRLAGYSEGILMLEKDGRYGFMDYTGQWIAQPIYTYAQPFCEGLAVIGNEKGKKAMIDSEGSIVLPFIYNAISNCSDGVIVAFEQYFGWTFYNKMSK